MRGDAKIIAAICERLGCTRTEAMARLRWADFNARYRPNRPPSLAQKLKADMQECARLRAERDGPQKVVWIRSRATGAKS